MKFLLPVRVKLAVQKFQTLQTIERYRLNPQRFEVCQNIRLNTFQTHFRCTQVIGLDSKGDVFSFGKAIVSFLELAFEHIAVFSADSVVLITPKRNINAFGKVLHVGSLVNEGKLHMDRGVKVIEKITISLKNLCLIIRLCKLIVNIEKLYRLGVKSAI